MKIRIKAIIIIIIIIKKKKKTRRDMLFEISCGVYGESDVISGKAAEDSWAIFSRAAEQERIDILARS